MIEMISGYSVQFVCLIFFFNAITNNVEGRNDGTFWHISDHHLDPYYNENAEDSSAVCPSSYGAETPDAGPLGDYRCDSPWKLINSSVYAMKRLKGDPDFIVWTGDDTLHTSDQETYVPADKVVEIIGKITDLLKEVFPDTKVYPVLESDSTGSDILSGIADHWEAWLTNDAFNSFKKNGFYKENFGSNDEHVLIALNSNFWYKSNEQVDGTGDPADEFAWLEEELASAKENAKKVFVIGHVPPGYFELTADEPWYWFYPEYSKRFNGIIRSYSDIIAGQFFGHHHTDHFKIFKSESGEAISSVLLAPGVTPWMTTLPGVHDGANNPGIRLMEFNRDSLSLIDYQQFYLNLPNANDESGSEAADLWELEYRATEAYNIPDISTASWGNLAFDMRSKCESNTTECPEAFKKYFLYNSVSYNHDQCDTKCQKYQLCAMNEVDYEAYKECFENWGSSGGKHQLSALTLVFFGLAVFLLI